MKTLWLLPLLALVNGIQGQIKLPKIFSDSMVLQRNHPITIWGWAMPEEMVGVQFHGQQQQTKADATGKWQVKLKPETAGGPYDIKIKGKTDVTLKGVLVGDIWLCSGQSNMEMPLKGWGTIFNAEEEIAAANHPKIRLFTVEKNVQGVPVDDVKGGEWKTCTPQNIPLFSAVGYFFGRALHQQLKVPIGLINATWGGTNIETWISHSGFESEPYFQPMIKLAPSKPTAELAARRAEVNRKYAGKVTINQQELANLKQWKEADYNDAGWPQMQVPGAWEKQQPGEFDGVIWFRKEMVVEEAGEARLQLGQIDDFDDTYVNGVRVGGIKDYNAERTYTVNLQKGKNVIVVKVEDTGGDGGFYSEPEKMVLVTGDKKSSLAGPWKYQVERAKNSSPNVGPNDYPSLLYNGMVHPIEQLPIKGVIWYQGESNAGRATEYRKAMPLLIKDWRTRYHQPNMPFYMVQLSSWKAENGNSAKGSTWAELREAQALTAAMPNSGMAVTIDIGDTKDIHPRNKQDVGKRLAAVALQKTYGITTVALSPEYKTLQVKGNQAIVQLSNAGKGLTAKSAVKGFEIAGADQKFYPAKAGIAGATVVVSSPDVTNPVAVRYAWADDPGEANLVNKDGFPVAPFRTDNWKAVTADKKYLPSIIY